MVGMAMLTGWSANGFPTLRIMDRATEKEHRTPETGQRSPDRGSAGQLDGSEDVGPDPGNAGVVKRGPNPTFSCPKPTIARLIPRVASLNLVRRRNVAAAAPTSRSTRRSLH